MAPITSLHLDEELTVIPDYVFDLTSLVWLDLSNNRLTVLPKEISRLKSLIHLILRNNQLTVIPKELGQLHSLEVLDLNNNQLTVIPKELGWLRSLTHLDLNNNQLTVIPKELGQSPLEELLLNNNHLTVIPKEFGQSPLRTLHLNNNLLTRLPREIGQLKYIRCIDLEDNSIVYPPISTIGDNTRDILNYCRLYPDVVSFKERAKNMWKVTRLLYIGINETSSVLSDLHIEMIYKIQHFVLADPYVSITV